MPIDKTTRIVYIVGGVVILLALVVGTIVIYRARAESIAAEKELADARAAAARIPVYGWARVQSKNFVLPPGVINAWGPIPASHTQPPVVRYDLQSTEPVDTAALPPTPDAEGKIRLEWADWVLNSSPCYTGNVLQTQQTCVLTNGDVSGGGFIVIRDKRSTRTSDALGALAGAYLGAKEPLQHMAAENRVTVTFYAWQCIQNCAK